MREKILDSAQNVCIGPTKGFLFPITISLPNSTALNSSGLNFCIRTTDFQREYTMF